MELWWVKMERNRGRDSLTVPRSDDQARAGLACALQHPTS